MKKKTKIHPYKVTESQCKWRQERHAVASNHHISLIFFDDLSFWTILSLNSQYFSVRSIICVNCALYSMYVVYSPRYCGGLFSLNARRPSIRSFVGITCKRKRKGDEKKTQNSVLLFLLCWWLWEWGPCALHHWIQSLMEAILGGHPAVSTGTEWMAGWHLPRILWRTVQPLPKVKSLPHFLNMFQWVDCSNFSWIERLCTKFFIILLQN